MTKTEREAELFAFFTEQRETVDQLDNWGAWALDRSIRRTCFSLEGRYRPPQDDEDRRPALAVDTRSALKMAKALAPPAAPAKACFALSAWFIFRLRDNGFAAYMRKHNHPIGVAQIEQAMHDAVLVARNRIRVYNL